ncbi:cold-shock protein [Micromonospora endolithica]|uniref:Cold shock domain-containing protein n=1 Tax=Micromonospora endolithica TaxID=230091 RepID=A0A3A9ZHA2_9ACTN|nr:cold shock domain-containing protein [Micromonospora endolithica]RKN47801.1 cold shock domain-containing protein [Micromonospora endolithica]TWJ21483.1 putative cold-shock DNA-binding protein [Micromonospora endolithica]
MGRILRYDDVRGYGFIEPADGGDDVFVHANDLGAARHLVRPGMLVEYDVEQGERGPKVSTVRIPDSARTAPVVGSPATVKREDDGMCDVLTTAEFTAEVTELLIQRVPSMTGEQIAQARQHLAELARGHGWLES